MKVGDRVGHFRIVAPLGRGSMGEVWIAEHPMIRKRVAIKTIAPGRIGRVGARERFLVEAKVVAAIAHPHLVVGHDYGHTPSGELYFSMEFVPGQSLRATLDAGGRLSIARALRIGAQVADAVAAAHRAGVLHRDLKPGNVLLADGHDGDFVKVLDFGLARMIDATGPTDENAVLGTPEYMAPEQCAGSADLDERVDVYALGCVLYEMVTGVPPFVGEAGEVIKAHRERAPRPPSALVPGLPERVEAIVLRALEKDRALRQPSLEVLRDELLDVEGGGPDAPTLERPARARRRSPLVGTAAVAALSCLTFVATLLVRRHPPAALLSSLAPARAFGIHSSPSGAAAIIGGVPRGATPVEVRLDPRSRPVTVELRAPGYLPWRGFIDPMRDAQIEATLVAVPEEPSAPPRVAPHSASHRRKRTTDVSEPAPSDNDSLIRPALAP